MFVVTLAKSSSYQAFYPLTPYTSPDSLIITNNSPAQLFIVQSDVQPDDNAHAFCVNTEETILVHGNEQPIWVRGGTGPILVQLLSRTVTPFTAIEFPHDTMTSQREGFRRLRVDIGQTAFFEGREFRTFRDLSIPSGGTYTAKVIVPVNTILFNVSLTVDNGTLRLDTIAGAVTETTPFTEQFSIFGKNLMSSIRQPPYVRQNNILGGGDITGGTIIDTTRLVAATATSQQATVGGQIADERGVAPGTYYWKFTNQSNGTVAGTFHCFWEERPAGY